MIRHLAALALLVLAVARAEPVHVRYAAYAAGLNALNMDADFDVTPQSYRVHLAYRTVGTVGVLVRSQQDTVAEGRFVASRPVPQRFFSAGTLRGTPRVTQIDYAAGQPTVRQLQPSNDGEREAVLPAAQAGTIDTLSAMAQLMQQVNASGRCDNRARTFDGRRLAEMESRTAGQEVLAPTRRSGFAGPALRCDFEGRQTGGFMLDGDRAVLSRPQRGSAWFAAPAPGGPMIPVRIVFAARLVGEVTMYLAPREE